MTTAPAYPAEPTNHASEEDRPPLVARRFTKPGDDPYASCTWEVRTAKITDADGRVIFEMQGEVPAHFSQLATDIAISKYFRKAGLYGDPLKGETSFKQVVARVVDTIAMAGYESGLLTIEERDAFQAELAYMLIHQIGAFNSPVWFNMGLHYKYEINGTGGLWAWGKDVAGDDRHDSYTTYADGPFETADAYSRPQSSACFIQALDDDLMSIFELVKTEARLFKYGSGSGTNFSALRSKHEKLSGGGTSSGLMSFLGVFDKGAGSLKSAGTTRRAAKLVCVDVDHPEIEDFIRWKSDEERKAKILIEHGGYPADYNGEAYATVSGQNANNSVRVPDAFMRALDDPEATWELTARTTGETLKRVKVQDLWKQIVRAAWECADPGLQFDSTINAWHTCKETGPIRASNPCCLVGETLVDTSEGLLSIEQLADMDRAEIPLPHAYSFDIESSLPVLRRIDRAWVAGETKRLVEVTTRRGLVLRCTPDHGWLRRNGEYVEAQMLAPGDRLRKIGRAVNAQRGNRRYLNHRCTPEAQNGTVWQNRFVWQQMAGEIPEGFHVHHKNEDRTDDRFSNLDLREGSDHLSEHSAGEDNPRALDIDDRALVEAWEAIEAELIEEIRDNEAIFKAMKSLREQGLTLAEVAGQLDVTGMRPARASSWSASSVSVALRQGHVGRKDIAVTVWRWNAYIDRNGLQGALPRANSERGIRGKTWSEFTVWIEERRDDVNDSVLSVEHIELDVPVKVYDIQVTGTHNFGVTSPGASAPHTAVVANSEYMFLENSACNLASLNLVKFLNPDGSFDVAAYHHAIRVFLVAQEILVDLSSYPTRPICQNSHDYRPLGLGYANLGALMMRLGLPYDSDEARSLCGSLTAILTGYAYQVSAQMAGRVGAFEGFAKNRESMLGVIGMHEGATRLIEMKRPNSWMVTLGAMAQQDWAEAKRLGVAHGYRNAQVSVLAPTGTIGLLMDCDTTGIEPDFALVKHKKLAGGGTMKIVNQSVASALRGLGYEPLSVGGSGPGTVIDMIEAYVLTHDTIEGAPRLKLEDLPVFDCATAAGKGTRSIAPEAHVRMIAAAQPFVSGSISKTCNVPHSSTEEDISGLYRLAWDLGCKCVAVYRDGCKASQPLASKAEAKTQAQAQAQAQAPGAPLATPSRKKLPKKRSGYTQWGRVGGHKIYIRTGEYEDGTLGEVFLDMHKEGAAFRSLMNMLAMSVSIGLQYGVPLEQFVRQFTFTRFEPAGVVEGRDDIKMATSIVDFIFRVLAIDYLGRTELGHVQDAPALPDPSDHGPGSARPPPAKAPEQQSAPRSLAPETQAERMSDCPMCPSCGHMTVRNAACYRCLNCGESLGCS